MNTTTLTLVICKEATTRIHCVWSIDVAEQQQVNDVAPHQPAEGGQSSVGGDNVSELEQLMKESQRKITGFSFAGHPASTSLFTFTAVPNLKPAAKSTFGGATFVSGQAQQQSQKQQPAATFREFSCNEHLDLRNV